MEYQLSWKGILNSGKLDFSIGRAGGHKPGIVVIRSTGKSMGPGGTIFPYNGHGWSEIHARSLRPTLSTATEQKRGKKVKTSNRFTGKQVRFHEWSREKKKGAKVEQHVFAHGPAYDIGSAILFIRSQRLSAGDRISILMHPYSNPYLLRATVVGPERLEKRHCIKLRLELSKIDLETLQLKPYKKLKEPATLWFSDDRLRLPLEIRSKVFIGDIRATLEAFRPA